MWLSKSFMAAAFILLPFFSKAQTTSTITPLQGEYWWGGATALGQHMPLSNLAPFNLYNRNDNNQVVPLFVSSKGRYIWSDKPFVFEVSDGILSIKSAFETAIPVTAGKTLKEAFLHAAKSHFPASGILPDELFFTRPQYNTWIELMYNQNQADILNYAHGIIDNGFPPGIIMIDDTWQSDYGDWRFSAERFPNPKQMMDELHALGFKVMVWICPFVSADSPEYRLMEEKGYLLKDTTGKPAIIPWWNGQSACYDFTNEAAKANFIEQLKSLQAKYGIDGFKFDGGDNNFYDRKDLVSAQPGALSVDHTLAWATLGYAFKFNEYRADWKCGGRELVQRLGDKDYSWQAVAQLIPDMIQAGLLGYAYTCPDMIGGGQFKAFLDIKPGEFDQDLIVRSAQVHALMPMMQFSVAPWRILDKENLEIVKNMALLHDKMAPYIMQQAKWAAKTGEPIVRNMEYEFPNQGYQTLKDQFMLGPEYLVAPMVTPGTTRTVVLPKGMWKDDLGKTWKGGKTITIGVPLSRLPYFQRLSKSS